MSGDERVVTLKMYFGEREVSTVTVTPNGDVMVLEPNSSDLAKAYLRIMLNSAYIASQLVLH